MSDIEFCTYFVKNGLLNGETGVHAVPAGGGDDPPQKDGWYYIVDGMDDGVGPYDTQLSAGISGLHYLLSLEPASRRPFPSRDMVRAAAELDPLAAGRGQHERTMASDQLVQAIVKWAYDRGCRDALKYGPLVSLPNWKHSSIPPIPEALANTLKELLK